MGRYKYWYYSNADEKGMCYRSKWYNYCSCFGNETKCDFFPDIRETAKLQKHNIDNSTELDTITMVQKAKEDGKTYKSGVARYNSKIGFYDANGIEWEHFSLSIVNDIFECKWQEENTMTKSEAEEKFGIKIVGD